MAAVKMTASRGSFFSSRRSVRRVGGAWRRVKPFGILCGDPRGAKSLGCAREHAGGGGGPGDSGDSGQVVVAPFLGAS